MTKIARFFARIVFGSARFQWEIDGIKVGPLFKQHEIIKASDWFVATYPPGVPLGNYRLTHFMSWP